MKQRHRPSNDQDKPQQLTRAVTHIRLEATNAGKLAALDELAQVYMALCQQYMTLFCTEKQPDKFHPPLFAAQLSERWHRVAIQQAAGIAQAWHTNRVQAYQAYVEALEEYHEQQASPNPDPDLQEPTWRE